jgi:hypothetical protein
MKRLVRTAGCFAAGLMLVGAVHANDTVSTDNPYGLIVARNVFGLNPPPPPTPPAPADPPPKITPNGIMSIFGTLQALYKVTVTVPGKPAEDKSYMLSEGQREDDIEVVKIDEKAATITFDNHGTVQELPLANGQASGGDGAGGGGVISGIPPRPNFGGFPGNRFAGNPAFNNAMAFRNRANGNNSQASDGTMPSTANSGGYNNAPMQPANQGLSPEAQAILMEANRAATQEQVDQGLMPPLPPTAITPEGTHGIGGQPLTSGPPIP